ncbi:mitochondrial uncoupling protein 3 [Vigna umbellata]|uniref:mitochondrial uncoupling protein 3 n=1 Tax=Vigna umbellata TaxID=87088 RepID=UPI001F5F0268|nr:mitochondrial uncoupling protein 3 [Vigna umbellata]XP_047157663.1 mitochondrial uncoupling protein 3 [Vigna umbellata]XP_047157664.1 mitochondrial uncoupling protein 3 [Vigna umbellata]
MKSGHEHGGVDTAQTKILLTSFSAMVAETTTFPIDLIKTRLQLHGESLSSSRPTSAYRVGLGIVREQSVVGLYSGLSPAIIRHLFYTPIRIVGYEHLRSVVSADNGSFSIVGKAVVGGTSGVMAQIIASPADLVKVRMQADGHRVNQGLRPQYSGPFDALNKIVRAEGFRGLWKGVFPNIQRAFLVNMGELACYDHAKQFVIRSRIADDNVYAHTLASIMSGLAATSLSCPADVVKTRMMNQAAKKEGKYLYNSSYDCLVKTVKVEGIRALWKGFFPTWARLGPWQFVFWVTYEKFRKFAGLSSF